MNGNGTIGRAKSTRKPVNYSLFDAENESDGAPSNKIVQQHNTGSLLTDAKQNHNTHNPSQSLNVNEELMQTIPPKINSVRAPPPVPASHAPKSIMKKAVSHDAVNYLHHQKPPPPPPPTISRLSYKAFAEPFNPESDTCSVQLETMQSPPPQPPRHTKPFTQTSQLKRSPSDFSIASNKSILETYLKGSTENFEDPPLPPVSISSSIISMNGSATSHPPPHKLNLPRTSYPTQRVSNQDSGWKRESHSVYFLPILLIFYM
jgi:hypothetical protein